MSDDGNIEPAGIYRRPVLRRPLVWAGVSILSLIVSMFLGGLLYLNYRGADIREFCNESLSGRFSGEVLVEARNSGFEVREIRDTVLITMFGKRTGHSCFLTIAGGKVSEVHTAFTH